MRYLCLVYNSERTLDAMPSHESEAFLDEHFDFTHAIQKSGHYDISEALEHVRTATTVRVRDGRISTTDGPFAETKEQLGGFFLVKATDLNEAIQLASRIPSARTGSIEVRPVVEFN